MNEPPRRDSGPDLHGMSPVEYGLAAAFVLLALLAAIPGLAIALHAALLLLVS